MTTNRGGKVDRFLASLLEAADRLDLRNVPEDEWTDEQDRAMDYIVRADVALWQEVEVYEDHLGARQR